MAFDYSKLWAILEERDINWEELTIKARMSSVTLAKLGKNKIVSTDVSSRICQVLACDVGDIVSYVEE